MNAESVISLALDTDRGTSVNGYEKVGFVLLILRSIVELLGEVICQVKVLNEVVVD